MTINEPGDVYEQEADRVADEVASTAAHHRGPRAPLSIQRLAVRANGQTDAPLASVKQALTGSGMPLEPELRQNLEQRFGFNFSQVRVHTGATAERSALDLNAYAYTVGHDIVFGAGRYAPKTDSGRRLLAHELAHVVQQSPSAGLSASPPASENAATAQRKNANAAPNLRATGPIIQRQGPVHKPQADTTASVPSEKWRSDVEAYYRRAGFNDEANAVHDCREFGICNKVLTQKEAYRAYRSGRIEAKLGEPLPERAKTPSSPGTPPVVAAGLAAPALTSGGGAAAESAVAKTALERAAVQWGTRAAISGASGTSSALAPVAEAATAGTAAAPAAGAAGVATVAVPIAIGVVLVIAVVDLFSYASFELALRRAGYIVLPDPLGVCIGLCHTSPARPAPRFPLEESPRLLPPGRLTPEDRKRLEDWLKPQPRSTPEPVAPPVPEPKPKPDEKRKLDCRLVPRTVPRGNDPLSELFCSVVAMGGSYDIYSTMGVAEIDALSGSTWYECKCGLLSTVRAAAQGQYWAKRAIDKLTEQARRHMRIAIHCGYVYRLAVANKEVAEYLRRELPDIDVIEVNWEPCDG